MPTSQDKNSLIDSTNLFIFYLLSTSNAPQNNGIIHPVHSPLVAPPLENRLNRARVFLVGYCVRSHQTPAIYGHAVFLIVCFFVACSTAKTMPLHPTIRSAPATPLLYHHRNCKHQLLVGCCIAS
jgi:hypothetical protein